MSPDKFEPIPYPPEADHHSQFTDHHSRFRQGLIGLDRFALGDFPHPLFETFGNFWTEHVPGALEDFPALFRQGGI